MGEALAFGRRIGRDRGMCVLARMMNRRFSLRIGRLFVARHASEQRALSMPDWGIGAQWRESACAREKTNLIGGTAVKTAGIETADGMKLNATHASRSRLHVDTKARKAEAV